MLDERALPKDYQRNPPQAIVIADADCGLYGESVMWMRNADRGVELRQRQQWPEQSPIDMSGVVRPNA